MRFYFVTPQFVPMNPVLFPTFVKTFEEQGHTFGDNVLDADVLLIDLHTRISDYSQYEIDYIFNSAVPIATFDEWDRGGMSKEEWPFPLTSQQNQIFTRRYQDSKVVHFCRLYDKTKSKPDNLYPYEKPIEYEEPLLTPDELFNRPIDVTYIANDAPSRQDIKRAFDEDGRLKCNIILGAEKMPFDRWVNEYRKSKFFIAASGGGFSDEKKQNLFSICAILQERTDQLLLHPFIHLGNCMKFNSPPTKNDIDDIIKVATDKEYLYHIYTNGVDFMKDYYSKEYIANDILQKILKHCA